jgi:hypothetical protein
MANSTVKECSLMAKAKRELGTGKMAKELDGQFLGNILPQQLVVAF